MVRKTVKKRKLNDKPVPKKSKRKNASRNTASSPANYSTTSDLNYTLPDGNYFDSFDNFRLAEGQ